MQYPVRVVRATLHPRLRLRMVAFVVRHFTWDELQPFDEYGELTPVEVRHTTYVMVSLGRRRLPACVEIAIAKFYFRGNIETVTDLDAVGLPK